MDDRGRLAQPLKGTARWRSRLADHAAARAAPPGDDKAMRPRAQVTRVIERWSSFLSSKWPRGVGVTATTSLLFLDVDQTRERLKTNPWIADATVLKLYPNELQIGVKEREAFALWQKDGHVSVIADDGTVLEPYVAPRLIQLPLVVGQGAQTKAKEFLALLDRYPTMRDFVRASVLVGERRWNLRLKNGIDVRLPESDVAPALERLVALDNEKNLITRDIVAIDLRLPDRVTVRLSEAAAQARIEALKDKLKKKGGNA